MGNNASSQVGDAGGDDSRASSPLPGEDDGYDGLPRLHSSAPSDFHVDYSQSVGGVPTFSQPPQPPRKSKKSRKSNLHGTYDANHNDEPDAAPENNDGPTDDLEAVVRNLKSEPESPELSKSTKKKRRKAKAQISEGNQGPHLHAPEPLQASEYLTAAPEASTAAEEIAGLPASDLREEAPAPSITSSNSRKKKKKSKTDKSKGSRLDLNEDPIAGSDDEVVIPSSDRPSRRQKSLHGDDSSIRKFRTRTSIPAVSERDALAIEDVANEEPRIDVVESTQGDAPSDAPTDFLRRSREPEQYGMGEDIVSPSVTRQERRSRLTPAQAASVSLTRALSPESSHARLSNGQSEAQVQNGEAETSPSAADRDAMDVDTSNPRLDRSGDEVSGEDRRSPASAHSVDLPDLGNQDEPMENGTRLSPSQPNEATPRAPEQVDFMSTLDDDALVAMASTQPQPASDDDQAKLDQSSAADNGQRNDVSSNATGNGDDIRSPSKATSGISHGSSPPNGAQTRAGSKQSRMALEFMLDGPEDAVSASPPEDAPESEPGTQVEHGRGRDSSRPDDSNKAVDESLLVNSNNHEAEATMLPTDATAHSNEGQSTSQLPATQTPRAERSSAHSTPRGSRTYTRQPKLTFFERSEKVTAQAFEALPSNEVTATPKPTKSKPKRRLPVDIPDAEPRSSKRLRSSLSGPAKAVKSLTDPVTPSQPTTRRKAPETAARSSTGLLTGPLTKTEVQQIEGAVEAFRTEHDLTLQEVNTMVQQNPKDPTLKDNTLHEELWSRVLDACPTRQRRKLLNWCRQKYHNFVARATWTPEQDQELREMVKHHGTKWSVIGQLINRHQKDVRDRWRNYLVAGENQRKNHWSEEEEREFLGIVGEVLGIFQREREKHPNSDMFRTGKTNEELVDWNVVAERMQHGRSRLQCQEKWRRMREGNKINSTLLAGKLEPDQRWRLKRARHEISTMTHADMYHIVLAITTIDRDARSDNRINWKRILESQRKRYHRYTGMLLWNRLRQLVPDQEKKDVLSCAKELMAMYQSDGGTFALPGDGAFDDAEEEALLTDLPLPRTRGSGKAKAKKEQGRGPSGSRVISDEFVHDSDSEEDDGANDGDSSRANYNGTSPAPEAAAEEQTRNGHDDQMRDADEVSLDLSNDAGHDDRGWSVDLGVNLAPGNGHNASDGGEKEATSPKSRKKTRPKAKEEDATPSVKKHRKRYSGDMTLDVTPKKNGFAAINGPKATESAKHGRKRARAEDATDIPNGSAEVQPARKKKRAKRASDGVRQVKQQVPGADGAASSDDDMEDIPARLPAQA